MQTFVVTGAGTGIGRATAIELSKLENVKLILISRTMARLEETRMMLENNMQHHVYAMDIRHQDEWKEMLRKLDGDTLNISGVFANAGIGGENRYGDHDRWNEILSVNLGGTYTTIQELLPYIKKSTEKFRNIVITSSCLARFGVSGYTAYCTAKAGLLGLTKSLAVELGRHHILVNAICPGWVETDMAKTSIQRLANLEKISYDASLAEQMSLVPLNRISRPDEIAQLVKFLMTNQQTSITGQGIDINNGSFMI